MRSKEAFAYSRSTGYFCPVAASTVRVSGSSKRPDPPRLGKGAGDQAHRRREPAIAWRGPRAMVASRLFSNSGGRGCWRGVFLERDGGAHVLLSTPARKCLNQGSALKRGVSRTPLPRSLSAAGFVSHSRRQLLAKRRHGSLARSRQHSLCASVSYVRHEMAVIRGRISS